MKLTHPLFSAPVRFREDRVQVLVIEAPEAFRKLVAELTAQSEGGEGTFVLSRNDTCLEIEDHIHVIFDFIHPQALEKKLQSKALASLIQEARETLTAETLAFSQAVQAYLGKLAALADYPVAFAQSENLPDLLKAMEFRVDLSDLPAFEALYERMALIDGLTKHQCFTLVNARAYFSAEELKKLYAMARYRKLTLLMIESHIDAPLPDEDIRLFDADLCELTLDSEGEIV